MILFSLRDFGRSFWILGLGARLGYFKERMGRGDVEWCEDFLLFKLFFVYNFILFWWGGCVGRSGLGVAKVFPFIASRYRVFYVGNILFFCSGVFVKAWL